MKRLEPELDNIAWMTCSKQIGMASKCGPMHPLGPRLNQGEGVGHISMLYFALNDSKMVKGSFR